MNSNDSNSISSVDLPSTTDSAQKAATTTPSTSKDKGKAKGKAAKQRDAEKFRFTKNKQFDNTLNKRLNDLKISESVESLFGVPRLMTAKPDVSTTVSVTYLLDISNALINVLQQACKVTIDPDDAMTLFLVSFLQVESKVWFSAQASQFAQYADERSSRARRVKASLPDTIFPLSFYIEQFGWIDIEGQKIIPSLNVLYEGINTAFPGIAALPADTVEIPEGNNLTGARQWLSIVNRALAIQNGIIQVNEDQEMTLAPEFLENPQNFNYLGLIRISPVQQIMPSFDQLVNRFNLLIGKIKRRVQNVIVPIDYASAKGTTAQLVTSECIDAISTMCVWSNRYITDDSLITGCLLRLGYDLADVDESHTRGFRCVEAVLEAAGSLQRFVGTITNRLR